MATSTADLAMERGHLPGSRVGGRRLPIGLFVATRILERFL